jgi:glycosyltransferase involved in cell wall biosynthesis
MLTCGIHGRNSAITAGCSESKIFDFPYVVDSKRILLDKPILIPVVCRQDVESGKDTIFFSGRMIQRKGLTTLIHAVAELVDINNWVLWIEGDGPLLANYIRETNQLMLKDRCRFLGFCQMSVHSWLLRNSDVVVVPSLRDSWGIVVDEGMQLGNAVVASDETGSGADRILINSSGLIFSAGNHHELSDLLRMLLVNPGKRVALGNSARLTGIRFSPKVNVMTIYRILRSDHSNC